MDSRLIYSLVLNIQGWILLACNFLCLFCIIRGYNIISNTGGMLIHVIFVGPSVYLGERFYDELVVSSILVLMWFITLNVQLVLAINRVSIVLFPNNSYFTQRRIVVYLFIATVLSFFLTTLSQKILMCCQIIHDPVNYGYQYYPRNMTNYSVLFVNTPVNLFTSGVCLISYITFFVYAFKMKRSVKNAKMVNEIRLCFQCVLMFLMFTASWLMLVLFPEGNSQWRMVMTIGVNNFFGVDAVIYLMLNKEINSQLRSVEESFLSFFSTTITSQ